MNLLPQPLFTVLSLGVTAALVGALIAAMSNWLGDRSRRKFEIQRWRAQFYLQPKLEAIRALHAAMVTGHNELNTRAKALVPRTVEEHQRFVQRPVDDFLSALTLAEIYLDEETSKLMHEVLGVLS